MNNESGNFPWKGFIALIALLVIVSIVAFVLSSIESFLAGVAAVFIGFLLSFFRDDLKRVLGLTSEEQEPIPVEHERVGDELIEKLDKYIAKDRGKVEKLVSKFESKEKPEKKRKAARKIVEASTALIATIDSAKSRAIQLGHPRLVEHYEELAEAADETRAKYEGY